MNPLGNKSSRIPPFLRSLLKNIYSFDQSIMEVIFPIGELIDGELTMVDVVVSILFEGSIITWDGSQRIDVLHSE